MKEVKLKFTGDIWSRMKSFNSSFTFKGTTLGDLLEELFKQYDLRDLMLDENDRIIPWSRIIVNGRFAEFHGNLSIPIRTGDEIVLIHPYLVM